MKQGVYMTRHWKLVTLIAAGLLLLPIAAHAQELAIGSSTFAWDQDDADAPALTYLQIVNGGPPTVMAGVVTCAPVNGDLHQCQISVEDLGLSQGRYDLQVQARRVVEGIDVDGPISTEVLAIVRAEMPSEGRNLVIIVEAQ